ncbi:uncharacterized protein N7469_006255 [Penicillium citrinum]|uniref:Secreted protein n=1 Tax=Penicillium citrinum TaxID=5077 RepID=A0A9W9TME8_PENCI|nr:uncharacterized protein N7469_006255 [Penicillium citrinum]KAJ5231667.1 hypothetical protein N7469_006255 [Penicillium citrinum]
MAKSLVLILYTFDLFQKTASSFFCVWIQYHDCGRGFTQIGHVHGHRSKFGGLLKEALFLNLEFDSKSFLIMVEAAVHQVMRDIDSTSP